MSMISIPIPYFRRLLSAVSLLASTWLLANCSSETVVNTEQSITINTNAVVAGYQDGPIGVWEAIVQDNDNFKLLTTTFTIHDRHGRFVLVIICPSSRSTVAHRVDFYYMTTKELQSLDQTCSRPAEDIGRERVIGQIIGINNQANEQARVTLDLDNSTQVYEAYGLVVNHGLREGLALKGEMIDQKIIPNRYFIKRRITYNSATWSRQDIDFTNRAFTGDAEASPTQVSLGDVPLFDQETSWRSHVGFMSERGVILKIAKSTQPEYSFQGVPLIGNNGKNFMKTNEGHEIVLQAFDEQKQITRQAVRLFKTSANRNTTNGFSLLLPQAQPAFADFTRPLKTPRYAQFEVEWQKKPEDTFGPIAIYRWTIKGETVEKITEKALTVNARPLQISDVTWTINISNGWLDVTEEDTHLFVLPNPSKIRGWQKAWGLKSGQALNWQLQLFSSRNNAGHIIHYLLHRQFNNGLLFGETKQKGTITSLSE